MCALCSSALTMPAPQAQPVPVPQNKPAMTSNVPKAEAPASTPPIQPPTVQQPTVQQPAPAAPPVATNPSVAQPVVRPRGTSSGISINNALQQKEKSEEVKEETWDNAFTQEQLTASWADFVNRYKSISQSFAAAIGKYTPKVIEGSEIHFNVDNLVFEQNTDGMSALKHHLKNSLHNNQFKLIPEVMERPAEIEAYTDKDKFEKMAEERPYLRTLQTELKLEGDL